MKSSLRAYSLLVVILVLVSGSAWARSTGSLIIQPMETAEGDKWVRGQVIKNEGTVKGDFLFFGQNVSSTGTVEGDAIGAGQDIYLAGTVQGNVRVGGASINVAGRVGKNATLAGGSVSLAQGSIVDGSVTAFGSAVNTEGKIKGKARIGARHIVLGGEIFGDVNINDFDGRIRRDFDRHYPRDFGERRWKDHGSKVSLVVLPGANIHGTLTFRGGSADIRKGAQVKDFKWVKPSIPPEKQKWDFYWQGWKFLRFLFSTAVYLLIGLLLLRLFPPFFTRAADYLAHKPWNAAGRGVIGLLAGIGIAIGCVILLVLSIIMSPAFGIVTGITATAFYALFFFLAILPVGLWLGTLMLKAKPQAYRWAVGLVVLSAGVYVLRLLGGLPAIGPVFPAIACAVKFCVVVLGGGALLQATREAWSRGRGPEGRPQA
jgi:hypothetical protein